MQVGSVFGFRFTLSEDKPAQQCFSQQEIEAIREGVNFVKEKTATAVSIKSHELSRAWREAEDGDELNIYTDLLSDEEFYDKMKKMERLAKVFDEN